MSIATNQQHTKHTFIQAGSRLIERAAFYGMRSIIVLYMISDTAHMSHENAMAVYSWFTISVLLTPIIGALVGDFGLGNKNTLIIGSLMQALGIFCFCIPSILGVYIGLIFISLGTGFTSPNMLARFGKLYLHKTKLLDAGFSIFYTAVNIGAFIGAFCMSVVMMNIGATPAFITCGIFMLLSMFLSILSKEPTQTDVPKKALLINKNIEKIIIGILVVAIFWVIYEIAGSQVISIQMQFDSKTSLNISPSFWQGMGVFFLIPICLIMSFIWTFYYSTQFTKLAIGFIIGTVAYSLVLTIPNNVSEGHLILYIFSIFLLSVAETYIGPVVNSILTEYTNPKYLTIMISVINIPGRLLTYLITTIAFFDENQTLGLLFSTIVMAIIAISLLIYILVNKKSVAISGT